MSRSATALEDELRQVEGLRLEAGAPLERLSTFRIGGPAELLVEAGSERALARLLAAAHRTGTRWFLLGLGSNVLIPDEGLPGLVVRLTGQLQRIRFEGRRVRAGGGVSLPQLARRTVAEGLSGLEALAGFPSTVGGAVVMNAGSYGSEIGDVLESVRVVDRGGTPRTVSVEELQPGYRTTRLQGTGEVVTEALFRLVAGDPAAGLARIRELNERRWSSLPSGHPNVGSIFRNPPGDYAGRLIEACGLKGLRRGGARISPRHANVVVNEGGASAVDVLELMIEARRAVERDFGIVLQPEVVLTGGLGELWEEAG